MNIEKYETINQQARNPISTSERYAFVPTRMVLDVLREFNWHLGDVSEATVRNADNRGFQMHRVKLVNPTLAHDFPGALPYLTLVNSHDGGTAFNLFLSILEKVCLNGLIAYRNKEVYRIPHIGFAASKVEEAARAVAADLPGVLAERERMQDRVLTPEERSEFADRAVALRFSPEVQEGVYLQEALIPRRKYLQPYTLWNTFNIIQESIIRGGIYYKDPQGYPTKSRKISSIKEDVRLNRELWKMAQGFLM